MGLATLLEVKGEGRGEGEKALPHILVPVLIQTQRATGVLHKQLQDTNFVVFDFWHFFENSVGDEVTASALCRKRKLFLRPGHCCLWVY